MVAILSGVILVASLGIGFLASLLGVGGGFLLVPILVFSGLNAHLAVGTSVASVTFTGISSFTAYYRQRRGDYKLALLLEGFTVPASILGSYISTFMSCEGLEFAFAITLVAVCFTMWISPVISSKEKHFPLGVTRKKVDVEGIEFNYHVSLLPAILLSFFAGMLVGLFGISGGILKVPILVICGVPVHIAVATSSLMILITSASAFTSHVILGDVAFDYLIFVIPGIIVGAQVGARISKKTRSKTLQNLYLLVMLGAAVIMLSRI